MEVLETRIRKSGRQCRRNCWVDAGYLLIDFIDFVIRVYHSVGEMALLAKK